MADDITVQISNDSVRKIVDTQIRAAVFDTLSKNQNILINQMVSTALAVRKDNYSSNKDTILETAISEMIRKEALDALKEWCVENAPVLRKALVAQMTKEKGFATQLATSLMQGIASLPTWRVTVNLSPYKTE